MFQGLRRILRLTLRETILITTALALICGLAAQRYVHKQELAERDRIIRREATERRWLFEAWVQSLIIKLEDFYLTEINGARIRERIKVVLPNDDPFLETPSVMDVECTIWVEKDTLPEFFDATARFVLENVYPSFANTNVRTFTPELVALYGQVRDKEKVDEDVLIGPNDGLRVQFDARPGRSPWLRVRLTDIPDRSAYRAWRVEYPNAPRPSGRDALRP